MKKKEIGVVVGPLGEFVVCYFPEVGALLVDVWESVSQRGDPQSEDQRSVSISHISIEDFEFEMFGMPSVINPVHVADFKQTRDSNP